ncbi:MAG: RNA polymerase factor sigma-54 [Endomicrobiales bacterium]
MTERDCSALIRGLESTPLFGKLKELGIIACRRPRTWNLASDFLEFDDTVFHHSTPDSDIAPLVEKNRDLLPVIRKIGLERFKSLFYENEGEVDAAHIASLLGLPVPAVKRIISLMNDISLLSEFFHPSRVTHPGGAYTKIAKIDSDRGRLVCGYYSLQTARGSYMIDSDRLKSFRKGLDRDTQNRLKEIVSRLTLINSRKNTVHAVIESLLGLQREYFLTGRPATLRVLSAKELAQELRIAPSSVSRAIFGRSIVTPHQDEIPLKLLLPPHKKVVCHILREILKTRHTLTDAQLREELSRTYGITVSRRQVCQCRNAVTGG